MAPLATSSRVRVCVRVREQSTPGCAECMVCDPERKVLTVDGPMGARSMRFDSIHDRSTTQGEFFERCGITTLLDAALNGYTATVFAYGQTGSGKTYTMGGYAAEVQKLSPGATLPPADPNSGLMQRTARYLYAGMSAHPNVKFTVQATYLEVPSPSLSGCDVTFSLSTSELPLLLFRLTRLPFSCLAHCLVSRCTTSR